MNQYYSTSTRSFLSIPEMHPNHLLNAFLKHTSIPGNSIVVKNLRDEILERMAKEDATTARTYNTCTITHGGTVITITNK